MITHPRILHVIDDTTAGGVTRVVNHLATSDRLARVATTRVHPTRRGRLGSLPKDVDLIISHTVISWRTLPALIALRAARPNTPIIHVEHSYTEGFVAHNVRKLGRFKSLLKIAFSLFDRVVAVSHAQADWMLRHDLCPSANLVTIPSTVDLNPFHVVPAPTGPIRTFGAIGRLDRQKGFDQLIKAFRVLKDPDLRLRIFGQGPEEHALRSLAGDDVRICFSGHTSDPVEAYTSVDAVVMPSRWEAFGLVAVETLAAGRTLLCAEVDGLKDHASSGATYIPGPSINDLVIALDRLISSTNDAKNLPSHRHFDETSLGLWRELIACFCSKQQDATLGIARAWTIQKCLDSMEADVN